MSAPLKHLLSTRDLDLETISWIFSRAERLKRMRAVLSTDERVLYGETTATLFWEASTRTRVSFELAAIRLGACVVHLAPKDSSIAKGESLHDTIANLFALGCRYFVVRHSISEEVKRLADKARYGAHLINAGDGTNEHPSQALLDAFTIRERKKTFQGLKIAILGDILRSRVARSNLYLLTKLGAQCFVAGPPDLVPEKLNVISTTIAQNMDEALTDADVVMVLRLQKERDGKKFEISDSEYFQKFGLTRERLALAKPDAIVMHPGPLHRGVEIDSEVADGPQSVILKQVENGLFLRMAIFEALRGELG